MFKTLVSLLSGHASYMRCMALGIKIVKIANVYGFKIFYKTGVKKIQDFKIFIKKLKTLKLA